MNQRNPTGLLPLIIFSVQYPNQIGGNGDVVALRRVAEAALRQANQIAVFIEQGAARITVCRQRIVLDDIEFQIVLEMRIIAQRGNRAIGKTPRQLHTTGLTRRRVADGINRFADLEIIIEADSLHGRGRHIGPRKMILRLTGLVLQYAV